MEREFRQSTNALTLLAGVSDMSPYLAPHDGATPMLVQQLAAGTPSEMLANRPDILAAEHRLKARNADIGAARAAFFPRISLTGMFGSASSTCRICSRAASAPGPSRRRSRCRSSTPAAIWRIWTWPSCARTWRWPSTNSPSRPRSAKSWTRWRPPTRCAGRKTQRAQAASSQAALALSEARYRGGVDNYLRYLDAQRSDFANQIALIEVRTERQAALASLFRALGGGWRGGNDDVVAQAATRR